MPESELQGDMFPQETSRGDDLAGPLEWLPMSSSELPAQSPHPHETFVCPMPPAWHERWQRLKEAWERDGSAGRPPPIPLILGGWAFSSDVDKLDRWMSLLAWAEERGLLGHVRGLTLEEQYRAPQISAYVPFRHHWSAAPKTAPSPEVARAMLQRLQERWQEIAGPMLAPITSPITFTGAAPLNSNQWWG
jgi:hypothetical protein